LIIRVRRASGIVSFQLLGEIAMRNRIHRHLHKLYYLGAAMMIAGVLWPWLILLRIFKSTFVANFMAYALIVSGGALVIVGVVFDNFIDRH
jgi:hypothetical protein